MIVLRVILSDTLSLEIWDEAPSECVVNGVRYAPRISAAQDQLVFYDWLVDPHGHVCGLEVKDMSDAGDLFSPRTLGRSYVTWDGFPKIMFDDVANPECLALEAFSDLSIYRSDDMDEVIDVQLDGWLNQQQIQGLLKRLTPQVAHGHS